MKSVQADINRMKPYLSLSEKDLPEIKEWEVGNDYKLLVEIKMTNKSISEVDGKKPVHCGFEISKVKAVDGSAGTKDFKKFEEDFGSKK